MKSGNTTISAYSYDGLGHRITETPDANVTSGDKTDLFYSAQWQVIEEDTNDSGLTLQTQYVWSPVYVNALIFRDYDFNADGVFEITDRTYAMQDANYDVTTLLDYDNHTLVGDINGDLHVDDLDQTLLLANWQQSVTPGTGGDLNGDGFVDIVDLTLLVNHFGDSDGFKDVEHFAYSAYGVATCYDSTWTTTSDTLDWNYLFQGGRLDKSTGDELFQNRDDDLRTGTWLEAEPSGSVYVDGMNLHEAFDDNPINRIDPTGQASLGAAIPPLPEPKIVTVYATSAEIPTNSGIGIQTGENVTGEFSVSKPQWTLTNEATGKVNWYNKATYTQVLTVYWKESVRGAWAPIGKPVVTTIAQQSSEGIVQTTTTEQTYDRFDAVRNASFNIRLKCNVNSTTVGKVFDVLDFATALLDVVPSVVYTVFEKMVDDGLSKQDITTEGGGKPDIGPWMLTQPAEKTETVTTTNTIPAI